ncbi:MAG: protein jag [Armatimonadetes bacterium]|nr:protein jag [Armatimonadota bacterium]
MEPFEQTGKSIEEAKSLALEHLGLTEDRVDIEVLDEGAKSFLGLLHSPARIRVTLKGEGPPARAAETDESAAIPPPADAASGEEIRQFVQSVLDAMGLETTTAIRQDGPEQVDIEITGSDTAILIGKHGQTLSALQTLVAHIVNRKTHQWKRVLLDAEHYRERHEETLRELALTLARDVKRKGQEAVVFEARDPRDRRVIHMALADHPDVYTYSEGEGEDRRVVISPKN